MPPTARASAAMMAAPRWALLGISMMCAGQAHAVLIDFEGLNVGGLNGTTYIAGRPIPTTARLSTQLLQSQGVKFTSSDPYVAFVRLGAGHASSGVHGIGGARNGLLSTNINDPITISFFIPTDPTRKAITTMVPLRTDRWGERRQISLVAYDEKDVTLATLTAVDFNGPLLSITHPGIHKVSFFGTTCCGGAGVDDLSFAPLTPVASTNPVNVPGPLPVLGALSAWHASRKLRQAARGR